MDLNSTQNGIVLACTSGACSAVHSGSHLAYNNAFGVFLNRIDGLGLSNEISRNLVAEGIERARANLLSGLPIQNSSASQSAWQAVFDQVQP